MTIEEASEDDRCPNAGDWFFHCWHYRDRIDMDQCCQCGLGRDPVEVF